MKIALTGMTMVGKTTLAEKLSNYYGILHIDTDSYLEQKHSISIESIFSQHREEYFRMLEQQALTEILSTYSEKDFILSCGGGLPCFYDNMQLLNKHTYTIYLDAPLSFFEMQLQNNAEWKKRPLLQQNNNPLQIIETLLEKRKPFYEQANYIQTVHSDISHTFRELVHHLDTIAW